MNERPASAPSTGTQRATATQRLAGLDALRGFALSGIIFVNIPTIVQIGFTSPVPDVRIWLDTFVQGRFFPIFSLLFGLGFGMLWRTAGTKTRHPRMALFRRLIVLGILGALHQLLQPGEALLPYAVCGLIFLLPATFLPDKTWAKAGTLTLGVLLLAAGTWQGGGIAQIPGLFLIGFVGGLSRVPERISASRSTWWISGSLAAVTAASSSIALATTTPDLRADLNSPVGPAIGLLMAASYVFAFVCLLHSPLKRALIVVFAPLGTLALTNYVTATILIIVVGNAIVGADYWGLGTAEVWRTSVLLCLGVLLLQWISSTLWLRRFTQGPLERVWRIATWWSVSQPSTPR